MSPFCIESETIVEEMTEMLRNMPTSDVDCYPNKYCEVLDNFHSISYEPNSENHLEFEDLSSEVTNVAESILKSKDTSIIQVIYEDFRLSNDNEFEHLWNEERGDYDDISGKEKLNYSTRYVMSNFEYGDGFDFDEEMNKGYKRLAIEGYDRLGNLISSFYESEKGKEQIDLLIVVLLHQISMFSLKLSEYYITGDENSKRGEIETLVKELHMKALVLLKKLRVNLEDVFVVR